MFGIDDAIGAVSGLADTAIKRIWPDATEVEKVKAQAIATEMQNEFNLLLGQIDVNKIEAQSQSLFKSGWRPFIGWVCGLALAYAAIIEPLSRFIANVAFGYSGEFPTIDTTLTMQILLGMLGLGGMRSFEKHKKVHKD
jgi:hypothetical protein